MVKNSKCSVLMVFSSEGSFTFHTQSYPKDVILSSKCRDVVKEQSQLSWILLNDSRGTRTHDLPLMLNLHVVKKLPLKFNFFFGPVVHKKIVKSFFECINMQTWFPLIVPPPYPGGIILTKLSLRYAQKLPNKSKLFWHNGS